jgi:hypothetical protein
LAAAFRAGAGLAFLRAGAAFFLGCRAFATGLLRLAGFACFARLTGLARFTGFFRLALARFGALARPGCAFFLRRGFFVLLAAAVPVFRPPRAAFFFAISDAPQNVLPRSRK